MGDRKESKNKKRRKLLLSGSATANNARSRLNQKEATFYKGQEGSAAGSAAQGTKKAAKPAPESSKPADNTDSLNKEYKSAEINIESNINSSGIKAADSPGSPKYVRKKRKRKKTSKQQEKNIKPAESQNLESEQFGTEVNTEEVKPAQAPPEPKIEIMPKFEAEAEPEPAADTAAEAEADGEDSLLPVRAENEEKELLPQISADSEIEPELAEVADFGSRLYRSRSKMNVVFKDRKRVFTVAAAVLVVLLGAYTIRAQTFKTKFLPNTHINGIDASFKTPEEVKDIIRQEIDSYKLDIKAREGGEAKLSGEELGVKFNFDWIYY